MAYVVGDSVHETTTTTGTSTITLAGAVTGCRAVSDLAGSNGDTFHYSIRHRSANEWESGLGTRASSTTFTRTTVIESSNSNAAVNFSAGTKDMVICALAKMHGKRHYVHCTNSATQSIADSTIVALTWDTEEEDTDAYHSTASNTSRLTAPFAGLYTVAFGVDFAANAVGIRFAYPRLNGSTIIGAVPAINALVGGNTGFPGSTLISLATGDYIEAVVFQNSGGALNANASLDPRHFFSMAFIGF